MDKKEQEFLKNYDSSKYEKPSVTTDVIIFTIDDDNDLNVLLIKRKNYPFKDKWAIPGGFVDINESIDTAASRELFEETNLKDIKIDQIGTFGEVDRDPRMRVISIAYFAFVPKNKLNIKAGDDAKEAILFKIKKDESLYFINTKTDEKISEEELAFDHKEILKLALKRLNNRIDYTDDILYFLDEYFTIFEAKSIYESISQTSIDTNNFRRDFLKKFAGKIEKTKKTSTKYSNRAASVYRKVQNNDRIQTQIQS